MTDLIASLAELTQVSASQLWILVFVGLFSGLVRGFTGFALSAIVVACLASFIPPIQLLPLTFLLELLASLMLTRGTLHLADKKMTITLVVTNLIGWPIGLYFTSYVDPQVSQIAALMMIVGLSLVLLFSIRLTAFDSMPGTLAAGLMSGLASGIASVGGMVVALFALGINREPPVIRASLVLFLAISTVISFAYLYAYDTFSMAIVWRFILMAPFTVIGILIGASLFSPRLQPYYRRACLALLIGLSVFGLIRVAM